MSLVTEELEWIVTCPFDPPHTHTFPFDWSFGGPDRSDYRADSRWTPSTYEYYSDRLQVLHATSAFRCDDEAIDAFTLVASWFPSERPKWIRVRRPGEKSSITLPVIYNSETDEVFDT